MKREFIRDSLIQMVKSREITPEEAVSIMEEMEINDKFVPEPYCASRKWVLCDNQSEFRESRVLYIGKSIENCESVKNELKKRSIDAVCVFVGKQYQNHQDWEYEIGIENKQDVERLCDDVSTKGELPGYVLINAEEEQDSSFQVLNHFHFLFMFIQKYMLEKKSFLRIVFVTNQKMDLALAGFFKSIMRENPNYKCKVVLCETKQEVEVFIDEMGIFDSSIVKFQGDDRFVERIVENEELNKNDVRLGFRKKGTYVITGGCKGIGFLLAKFLAKRYQSKLILVGRSKFSEQIEKKLNILRETGAEAEYCSVDVGIEIEVKEFYKYIKEKNIQINGILHGAGCIRDSFLLRKTEEEMQEVLRAKVYGTKYLDEVFQNEKLDFWILFSSVIALTGNAGQSDYAYANNYMDVFAELRNEAVHDNKRYGQTVSINWAPWLNGGMQLSEQDKDLFLKNTGYFPISDLVGFMILEYAVHKCDDNCIFIYGKKENNKKNMLVGVDDDKKDNKVRNTKSDINLAEKVDEKIKAKLLVFLKELFADLLKLPVEKIDEEMAFQDYGIDSIVINQFNFEVEKKSIMLPKTILYECKSIKELVAYIIENQNCSVDLLCANDTDYKDNEDHLSSNVNDAENVEEVSALLEDGIVEEMNENRDIAIIGISGKYPDAEDCEELWENLKKGKNSVTEFPKGRWNMDKYYIKDLSAKEAVGTNCKWGGFLSGIDEFDASLFKISPREAELMDPQERIFIEQVWRAIENSAYSVRKIRENAREDGISKVGVFVGVTSNTYMLWASEQLEKGSADLPRSYSWSVANRISYLFDFNGPSVAIDTACSSSLSALHMACESIQRGESKIAIVGGVNIYSHPVKYVLLSQLNMLSPTGSCNAFGKDADGFVPGEGVGAIILKPVKDAERDGDRILAVIKGSAMNHGGASNGYTVPDPVIQAQVISQAMKNAKIEPNTISYIEAHGTGTKLGDPIEIAGLKRVFGQSASKYCAVGSIKANIGHAESAAGIAAVTKVVYQLMKKQIFPSIHSEEMNPNIDLTDTPFYIPQKLMDWKLDENITSIQKRRAGISSFGAGGTNVHIVLEEYVEKEMQASHSDNKQIVVMSANNKDSLNRIVRKMYRYLNENPCNLDELAFTLQVGRNSLFERIAFVASSIEEVKERFAAYLKDEMEHIYQGNYIDNKDSGRIPCMSQAEAEGLWESGDYHKIASNWAMGATVDFEFAWKEGKLIRLELPTYEFAKTHYWFRKAKTDENIIKTEVASVPLSVEKKEMSEDKPEKEFWLDYNKEISRCKVHDNSNVVDIQVVNDNIAIIKMNDRQNKNLMSDALYQSILRAFDQVSKDESIKAVVLTGFDHIFCMGGMREHLGEIVDQKKSHSDGKLVYKGCLSCPVPVISAMQGHAYGGGLMLGLFADIVIMAEESLYSANFARYGFTPGVGSTYVLSHKLGDFLAQEMMYTAYDYKGIELKERGATVKVCKRDEVLRTALEIASSIAKKPRKTLVTLKRELASRELKTLKKYVESEKVMHEAIFKCNVADYAKERIDQFFTAPQGEKETKLEGISSLKLVNTIPNIGQNDLYLPKYSNGRIVLNGTSSTMPTEETKLETSNTSEYNNENSIETGDIVDTIITILSEILHLDRQDINIKLSVRDLGMDSINGVELVREINQRFHMSMEAYQLYEFSSIKELIKYINCKKLGNDVSREKLEPSEQIIEKKVTVGLKSSVDKVIAIISEVLHISEQSINVKYSLKDLGMDSITGVELVRELNKEFHMTMETVQLYDFNSVKKLIEYIDSFTKQNVNTELESDDELVEVLTKLQAQQINLDEVGCQLEELL